MGQVIQAQHRHIADRFYLPLRVSYGVLARLVKLPNYSAQPFVVFSSHRPFLAGMKYLAALCNFIFNFVELFINFIGQMVIFKYMSINKTKAFI